LSRIHVFVIISILLLGATACSKGQVGDPAKGKALYEQSTIGPNNAPGCTICHSREPGKVIVGPSHAHVANRAAEVIQDPNYTGAAKTPEEYLRESIVSPDTFVEEGFAPDLMYQNYGKDLSEQEIADLVAYLMTLKQGG
jgi:cytochrome c2